MFHIKIGDVKIKRVDDSDHNAFSVDEIYCNDIHVWNRIKAFIDNDKNKN